MASRLGIGSRHLLISSTTRREQTLGAGQCVLATRPSLSPPGWGEEKPRGTAMFAGSRPGRSTGYNAVAALMWSCGSAMLPQYGAARERPSVLCWGHPARVLAQLCAPQPQGSSTLEQGASIPPPQPGPCPQHGGGAARS